MLILRDYQQEVDKDIDLAFEQHNRVLTVMATGAGKTVLFASRIARHIGAAAVVVHRKEIIAQISLALAKLEVKHRIVAPDSVIRMIRRRHLKKLGKSFINTGSEVGVISVQTITSAGASRDRRVQQWIKRVSLTVLDECHHYTQHGKWGRTLEIFQHSRILGVTATPERADGKGLGAHADGFAEVMVLGPSSHDLIQEGYLCPFSYHAPTPDLDLSDIPITTSGDVNTQKMRARIEGSRLVGDIVEHYKRFALGKRTIVFANDVATAEEHAEAFKAQGIHAVALSGATDPIVREKTLDAFEDGTGASVLINVGLFDEGFDVPAVEAVIMARATMSVARYLQMIGRALRPVYREGADLSTAVSRREAIIGKAVIIDAMANWERNGMPTWPRAWSLDSRERTSRSSGPDTERQRLCTNILCNQPYPAFHKVCPACGSAPEPQGSAPVDRVEGDLTELDVSAMNALFAKLRKANMSEADYQRSQIARNMPLIARGADLKRFRQAKARRATLEELMAWWCGFQPGRSQSELQRRFYYRFGIDMVTARTLDAKQTDALIQRITDKFEEDIVDGLQ
jgi:superfamily II DNA or RNA helicase